MERIGRRLLVFALWAFAAGVIVVFVLLVVLSRRDEDVCVTGEDLAVPSVPDPSLGERPLPTVSKSPAPEASSPTSEGNAVEGELRPDPPPAESPRVKKRPAHRRTGIVRGTVTLPDGKTVRRGRLWCQIREDVSAYSRRIHSRTIQICNGRFVIEPESTGILTIYGKVGKYWIVPLTLDHVDETTVMEDVHVNLEFREELRLPLVDGNGLPIVLRHLSWSVDPDVELLTRLEAGLELDYESEADLGLLPHRISGGSITLPFRPRNRVTISISGPGIVTKDFDLSPGSCPDRLALDLLAPICRGCVRLPPGASWSDMYLFVACETGSGRRVRTEETPDLFEEETGKYTIYRDAEEPDGAPYSVTFMLEGYKPWVLENIRLEKTETLEGVNVSFEKTD